MSVSHFGDVSSIKVVSTRFLHSKITIAIEKLYVFNGVYFINPGIRVQSLGWEGPLEKEMATHSSTLTWRIPWTEEPGGLQSMSLQRVGHIWSDRAQHIFRVFIEFVTILLLFYVVVFLALRLAGSQLPSRDWTSTPCPGRWSLSHWIARKVPVKGLWEQNVWEPLSKTKWNADITTTMTWKFLRKVAVRRELKLRFLN